MLCGIEAHICVLQSLMDLQAAGYQTILVADCVASRSDRDLAFAYERAKQEGAIITSAEAILYELAGSSKHPAFKTISALVIKRNDEWRKEMKIGIGNDHAAVAMKNEIKAYLEELGHEVVDFGISKEESCDYPVYGEAVGRAVVSGQVECGVLICGTGVGISIAANKVPGVRAAVCSDTTTARLVKEHNNANIIAFGARIVGIEVAKDIVKTYLDAEFQGGRHEKRIAMIHEIENKR